MHLPLCQIKLKSNKSLMLIITEVYKIDNCFFSTVAESFRKEKKKKKRKEKKKEAHINTCINCLISFLFFSLVYSVNK